MRAGMREFGELVNAAEARQLAAGPVVGEHTPGSVIDDPDFDFTARYLYAFWRLCEQKIATSEPAPVNHTARVLARRTGTDPRRADHPDAQPRRRSDRRASPSRLAPPLGGTDAYPN
jgi:hypothetical protein